VRILFAALHYGYFRNFESVVDELARRGHDVHLTAERQDSALGGREIVERLAARHATVTFGMMPRRERAYSSWLRRFASRSTTCATFGPSTRTRRRCGGGRAFAPREGLIKVLRAPGMRAAGGRRLIARLLDRVDRALPPSPAIERFVDEQHPDVAIITPLVGVVASSQLDLLRSVRARAPARGRLCLELGSSVEQGHHPRRARPPVRLERRPEARGARDARRAAGPRRRHRRAVLRSVVRSAALAHARRVRPSRRPAGRPALRALGLFGALPGKPVGGRIRDAVGEVPARRPAPRKRARADSPASLARERMGRRRLADGAGVAFWGGNPVDDQSRADYFDSLYHSAAVVGLNTSAFIEAGIAQAPGARDPASGIQREPGRHAALPLPHRRRPADDLTIAGGTCGRSSRPCCRARRRR
jgi:hypothetical protein